VELLANLELALRLDQIVVSLGDLARAVEPVARDPQILARDATKLARNLRLARQHVEPELGIGERGERLSQRYHCPILHQQFFDLPARKHAN
jgi:hypothetical protein